MAGLGKVERTVDESMTAKAVESGSLPVFSTPSLVALMECAAVRAIELEDGKTSVGISIDVKHTAATPVGMRVSAEANIIESDERTYTFKIKAYDECGPIGEAIHKRAVIDTARFMSKVEAKTISR